MPFGFEIRQSEKAADSGDYLENKMYVEVTAIMRKDSTIMPLSFVYEDEKVRVDKVISAKPAVSLKKSTQGYVYRCRTGNKLYLLGFDGERWYLEV